ncbi:unnamed protein product [Prorocentrum cordatum]|uniref:Uncharacterized protein n=1 Tax=Prorocentrum cordatum TaxID=2364126 RepID=A0ABN9T6N0_9DINO|nr:unnamed protein product [Polarella glacialis]
MISILDDGDTNLDEFTNSIGNVASKTQMSVGVVQTISQQLVGDRGSHSHADNTSRVLDSHLEENETTHAADMQNKKKKKIESSITSDSNLQTSNVSGQPRPHVKKSRIDSSGSIDFSKGKPSNPSDHSLKDNPKISADDGISIDTRTAAARTQSGGACLVLSAGEAPALTISTKQAITMSKASGELHPNPA